MLTRRIFILLVLFASILIRALIINQRKKNDIEKKYLAFQTYGKAGNWVLMLHGILGSHRYWSPVADKLSVQNKIIAPDLLGFGDSPKPNLRYTVQDHLDYLFRTVEPMIPKPEKFFIVGHSMGAILALNYAISEPTRVCGIVLINPPIITSSSDLKDDIKKHSSGIMVAVTFNKFWGRLVGRTHEMFPFLFQPFLPL